MGVRGIPIAASRLRTLRVNSYPSISGMEQSHRIKVYTASSMRLSPKYAILDDVMPQAEARHLSLDDQLIHGLILEN
jgi:hypothetical protein